MTGHVTGSHCPMMSWCSAADIVYRRSPSPASRVRRATGHARARRTYEISPRSNSRPGSPSWACSTGPTRARRRPAWTSAKDARYSTDLQLARRRQQRACVFWTKVAFHVWQPWPVVCDIMTLTAVQSVARGQQTWSSSDCPIYAFNLLILLIPGVGGFLLLLWTNVMFIHLLTVWHYLKIM